MQIKLMPEYECFPLWGYIDDELTNIDPENLPISKSLKIELDKWANDYEATYRRENPIESKFASAIEESEFLELGFALKNKLQFELGSEYEVIVQI